MEPKEGKDYVKIEQGERGLRRQGKPHPCLGRGTLGPNLTTMGFDELFDDREP